MTSMELHQHGMSIDAISFDIPKFIDNFLKIADSSSLCRAGAEWSDEVYDERILDKLLETENIYAIIFALHEWPKHRRDRKLLNYILKNASWKELHCAIDYGDAKDYEIHNSEYISPIMSRLLDLCESGELSESANSEYFEYILQTGAYWPNNQFTVRIANIFFQTQGNEAPWFLYLMGMNYSNKNFVPEIGYLLYKTGDKRYIEDSIKRWPNDRARYIKEHKKIVVVY